MTLLLMRAKEEILRKYCTLVIFSHFVYPLLIFVRTSFLQNPKPEKPGKLL